MRIKNTKTQRGDFEKYFSEILTPVQKTKEQEISKVTNTTNKKPNQKEILNKTNIEELFKNIQNDLNDDFLGGSIYSSDTGKPLYTFNTTAEQSKLFVNLHKSLNKLLIKENFSPINNFYLLDLDKDYLLFVLIFKKHHFSLAIDNSKIKLGYLFNIIRPLIINDYNNAINKQLN